MTSEQPGAKSAATRFAARGVPGLLIACGYGFALWFYRIFLPGNLSLDSFEQYEQAVTGVFNDHHPPFMAAVLRVLMGVGLGLKTLMAMQVLGGLVGVQCLVNASSRVFVRRDAPASRLAHALAFVVLVSPITPLMFYLMTFWKDSWFAIALVWTLASLSWLLVPGSTKMPRWLISSALLASASALVLARHNGIVLLPVVAAVLLFRPHATSRPRAAALAAATIVAALGASQWIYAAFDVERRYLHENYVMFHDLVALCETDGQGEGCGRRLILEAGAEPSDAFLARKPDLFAEWARVALAHPVAIARVKLELFVGTLNLWQGPNDYFDARVYAGFHRYGLTRDPASEAARQTLGAFTLAVARLPGLRLVLGSHALWFAISALGTLWFAYRSWRARALDPAAALLALPLAYYLSYVPIFTTGDFRYMYPATLAVQVLAIAVVTATIADAVSSRARPRDR